MIRSLIESAVIVESLDATTKAAVLDEMVAQAVEGGVLAAKHAKNVRKALEERETKVGSTGIGNGIAIPHVKLDDVTSVSMTLARSLDGVDYDAVDGRPVHTVFLIVSPSSAAEDHLAVLRWISGLARDADFRRFIQGCEDGAAIRELLREKGL